MRRSVAIVIETVMDRVVGSVNTRVVIAVIVGLVLLSIVWTRPMVLNESSELPTWIHTFLQLRSTNTGFLFGGAPCFHVGLTFKGTLLSLQLQALTAVTHQQI